MITLQKIEDKNIWRVIQLSVHPQQQDFVATNTQSILQAYTAITSGKVALPFGIYSDDVLVGFVMFGYGTVDGEDDPPVAKGNYCLWRLMIDQHFQGKGLGKQALQKALEYLRTSPCGQAEYCWLSYEPENTAAKALYTAAGFIENGQMCGDEIVSILKL